MIITKGYFSWNLFNYGNGMVKECPECDSREIRDEICMECGYKPSLQLWRDPPYGKVAK